MKKTLFALLQLALGLGLVAYLAGSIDRKTRLVEFVTPPVTVAADAVYAATNAPHAEFLVLEAVAGGTCVRALHASPEGGDPQVSGALHRVSGDGPAELAWSGMTSRRHGLRLIGRAFTTAARHGVLLGAGVLCFLVCLLFCVRRWQLLLEAQGLAIPFRRVTALYFVGQFFNSFMPGSTGGDLVKAYYAAAAVPHKRTEVVATVFIDRMVGLVSLVLLSVAVILARLPFFLSHQATRWALIFNALLLVGVAALLFAVFRRNLLEHWAWFRKLEEKAAVGRVLSRAYTASRICFNRPGLLALTMVFSLGNHLAFVFCPYFLGRALEIDLSFWHYLVLFPIINAVAGLPVTPGGLGTRDGAARYLLATVGVSATKALPLSLLIYVTTLFWGLVGGVVYVFYRRR